MMPRDTRRRPEPLPPPGDVLLRPEVAVPRSVAYPKIAMLGLAAPPRGHPSRQPRTGLMRVVTVRKSTQFWALPLHARTRR
jgi:hypothetical protein